MTPWDVFIAWWIDKWPGFFVWLTTGNAPGYLAVVVAAIGGTFAYRSSVASRKSAGVAQQQLDTLLDDKRKAQANSVSLWYEGHMPYRYYEYRGTSGGTVNPADERVSVPYPNAYRLTFAVQNASALSVSAAIVYFEPNNGLRYFVGILEHLPPTVAGPVSYQTYVLAEDFPDEGPPLGIMFVDAMRQVWDREPHGALTGMNLTDSKVLGDEIIARSGKIADEIDWKKNDRSLLFTLIKQDRT